LDDLRARIHEVGLGHHAAALLNVAAPAIRLTTHKVKGDTPLGSTKLGGLPDLPPGVEWPVVDGVLLEFVGQFRLADLIPYDAEGRLPQTGMLYFFFDGMLTGYDKSQAKDRCKVLYYPFVEKNLTRLEPPDDRPWQFLIYTACKVKCDCILTLPPSGEIASGFYPVVSPISLSSEDIRLYGQLRHQLMEHGSWFLGHPLEIQAGEFRYMIVAKRDTKELYRYEDYNFRNIDELKEEMKSWQLFFQVSTDQNTEMCWGDGGKVYFWIREVDLNERRFDQVEAMMQC